MCKQSVRPVRDSIPGLQDNSASALPNELSGPPYNLSTDVSSSDCDMLTHVMYKQATRVFITRF
ncbi:hypothetical protein DPMN_144034 [Dreissena polymorpha]|uniref:Uncharacterized protein n=1 Tax=Dreissena polymorpha TaxID=45954 RepID=A0A9D4JNT1_DREPO|nr:hypothetical protein DPMN_192391 [Dreissena polymorpha]KAH3815508.1 hypothetical protein DPMN_144034 [Dreissena polymorpha]